MNELTVISKKIITLPGRPLCMLDRDVAELYETETKRINQAVRRNPERFPEDFCFQLTEEEAVQLVPNWNRFKEVVTDWNHLEPVTGCDRFNTLKHSSVLPFAFTREGCNMLCAVLSTPIAIRRSIQIMRAFSAMERMRFEGQDAMPSPMLPNGWQMYELRMIYGPEKARKIMADLYGVGVEKYRTDITPHERNVISFQNPNVGARNHMIWELATKRGVSKTKLADIAGFSRNSITEICKKIERIHTKALSDNTR